jgi:SAM-dependent methyltransferase
MIGDKVAEAKVLDFGCGAGEIVKLLRNSGISAFGCEAFYGGGVNPVPDEFSGVILATQGKAIPFPACMFDVVINNQVMEHVEDIDAGRKIPVPGLINGPCTAVMGRLRSPLESISRRCNTLRIIGLRAASDR